MLREAENSSPQGGFVSLLVEHQQPLRIFIRALMPGRDEAWDVLQQTNAVLWTKKEDFELGSNFRAWAFKVARYEILAFFQRERRKGWLIFDNEMVEVLEEELPAEPYELEQRLRVLETCMEELKPHDKELLRRHYLLEGSLDSYAKELGRTVGTLKTRLFRLRAALRQCVRKHLPEGGAE